MHCARPPAAPRGVGISSATRRSAISCRGGASGAHLADYAPRLRGVLNRPAEAGAPRLGRRRCLAGAHGDQAPLVLGYRGEQGGGQLAAVGGQVEALGHDHDVPTSAPLALDQLGPRQQAAGDPIQAGHHQGLDGTAVEASSAGPSASPRSGGTAPLTTTSITSSTRTQSRSAMARGDIELRRYTQTLVGLILGGHPGVGGRLPWSLTHTPSFTRWEPIVETVTGLQQASRASTPQVTARGRYVPFGAFRCAWLSGGAARVGREVVAVRVVCPVFFAVGLVEFCVVVLRSCPFWAV